MTFMRREYRGLVETMDDVKDALDRLFEQQRQMLDVLEMGPVPGAYFPLFFHIPGALSATTSEDGLLLDFTSRPVYLSTWLKNQSGIIHCVIDVNDDGTSILTTPLDLNSANSYYERRDFASDLIQAGSTLTLDVDSINNNPADLRVMLVLKNLGRIEPSLNSPNTLSAGA
jgi:hypothetical protein